METILPRTYRLTKPAYSTLSFWGLTGKWRILLKLTATMKTAKMDTYFPDQISLEKIIDIWNWRYLHIYMYIDIYNIMKYIYREKYIYIMKNILGTQK
jgi:hypothetical protein